MKVFYKNKVGILTEADSVECSDCIFYPKNNDIYTCWHIGMMNLCCAVKYRKFLFDLNTSIFQL